MKKMITALMATGIIMGSAFAQTMSVGVKAGANFANLKPEGSSPYSTKTDLHGGLLFHIHVTDKFAFQPEVVYSGQGAKSKVNSKDKINLGYLNVPLLGQYMFSNGFRIETGPQAGILMSAKAKTSNVSTDIKDELNGFDLAWTAGLGYKSTGGLGVDARYNFGLSNINKDDAAGKLKNNVIQVGLFYQFNP
ncbi:MAG: porin family protein [Ferruginibacter sp.]